MGSIPGLGRSPGGGNGNPLQYSCLENSMGRGAWQASVHRVAKSQIRLSTAQWHLEVLGRVQSQVEMKGWSWPELRTRASGKEAGRQTQLWEDCQAETSQRVRKDSCTNEVQEQRWNKNGSTSGNSFIHLRIHSLTKYLLKCCAGSLKSVAEQNQQRSLSPEYRSLYSVRGKAEER